MLKKLIFKVGNLNIKVGKLNFKVGIINLWFRNFYFKVVEKINNKILKLWLKFKI